MLMPGIFGESLFDEFFDDFARPVKGLARFATPVNAVMRTDVKESGDGYELAIDLPGYKKEDVQARLQDGYLTITASTGTNEEQKDESGKYLRRERYYGACSRSFYVGDEIGREDIKAKFEDGTLRIAVPKREAKPKVEEKQLIAIEG